MNVFRFEFQRSLTSLVGWTVGILAGISLFMQGMYPIYRDSADEIMEMMKSFPEQFMVAFGFTQDIFSFRGFYSFSFNYLLLFGVMFACSVTLSVFGREKKSRSQEFLYAKPMTRQRLFGAKLAAVLTILMVSNGLVLAWSAAVTAMAGESDQIPRILLAAFGIFLTQLLTLSITILYSVVVRRIRTISGPAMVMAFGGFILSALSGIIDKEEMRYIAPFKYFDSAHAVMEGGYELPYAMTGLLLFVLCMILSYVWYCRRDIRG